MQCFDLHRYFIANRVKLLDVDWLTSFLTPHCHFILQGTPGSNLRLLQCPREFAEFLVFMGSRSIDSYLEIGVNAGGSFYMVDSYLRAINPNFQFSVGYDKSASLRDWKEYRLKFPRTIFRCQDTKNIDLDCESYDMAFIDACHAEEWVLGDFEKVRRHSKFVAFHDIVLPLAGVHRAWRKIKARHDDYWEIIDSSLPETLGIGVIRTASINCREQMQAGPILADVIEILRKIDTEKRMITRHTLIFTELDFDSLQMLDLIETLKEEYGVDFFEPPYSLGDLRTPETVAAALEHTLTKAAMNYSRGAPNPAA